MPAALWQWAPMIYGSVNANSHCPYSGKSGGAGEGGRAARSRGGTGFGRLPSKCDFIFGSRQPLSCRHCPGVQPSSLPTIHLLFYSYSSPSLSSTERCFLISVGFKGVWGPRGFEHCVQTAAFAEQKQHVKSLPSYIFKVKAVQLFQKTILFDLK